MGLILEAKGVPSYAPFGLCSYFVDASGIDPKPLLHAGISLEVSWEFCQAETIQAHMMITNIESSTEPVTRQCGPYIFRTDSLDHLPIFLSRRFSIPPLVISSLFLLPTQSRF